MFLEEAFTNYVDSKKLGAHEMSMHVDTNVYTQSSIEGEIEALLYYSNLVLPNYPIIISFNGK